MKPRRRWPLASSCAPFVRRAEQRYRRWDPILATGLQPPSFIAHMTLLAPLVARLDLGDPHPHENFAFDDLPIQYDA